MCLKESCALIFAEIGDVTVEASVNGHVLRRVDWSEKTPSYEKNLAVKIVLPPEMLAVNGDNVVELLVYS